MQTKEMAGRETKHLTLILTLPLMQTKEMAGRNETLTPTPTLTPVLHADEGDGEA